MELLHFGVHPLVWFVLAGLCGGGAVLIVWYKVISDKTRPREWLVFSIIVFLGAMYCQYAGSDLRSNITKEQAEKLHVAYKQSYSTTSGYDFRKKLENLLDEKGVLVYGELSYIGSDIYAEHLTKKEWNDLVKIQKE